ncbi:MAG: hypothetical protein J7J71_01845 [Deltaproteobacteria bacterium]|nr:hypothetical protein [Candidatus Tharpella sp.]
MSGNKGYRTGEKPYRYGCQEYSLEMQLLQLKKRELLVTDLQVRKQLAARIEEIEILLGM